ncbi:MAG: hypothetical protein GXO33_00345 [Epsilonproteobacteria bacterium]|nr:hypothetical protein [Campylobacterota bacterium]
MRHKTGNKGAVAVTMAGVLMFFVSGCATKEYASNQAFGKVKETQKVSKVTLLALRNYTDVPDAGRRAANLVAGILRADGVEVDEAFDHTDQKGACKKAANRFVMGGGVSEWRYKTGIDGEPAVSLQLSLYDCQKSRVVWSATASGNDYWRASLGTTAQGVIEEMLED